jgi:hypothetical protein
MCRICGSPGEGRASVLGVVWVAAGEMRYDVLDHFYGGLKVTELAWLARE